MSDDTPTESRPPIAAAVGHGDVVITSGQTATDGDGRLIATGRVGGEVAFDLGRECAARCAHNVLAVARQYAREVGAELARLLEVRVFVACDPGFTDQHLVADAATSVLLGELGEERGRHARTAVGVPALPGGSPVEVQATFTLTAP
jgi:enamine deaminase RidA (YjgF/YER057c/UK114 family)